MNVQRKFVASFLLLALLFAEACNKKKPLPQLRAQAPTIAQPLPDEIPEKPEEPTPEIVETPVEVPPVKTKPKKPTRTATSKKATPPASAAASPAPAAPAPPPAADTQSIASAKPLRTGPSENAPDLAIAAAIPSAQVSQQKEDTAHMVDATETALKGLNRSLNDEEKAMRTQIESYLQQSRKATAEGDTERAYNLAKKAQLLAEALLKK